MVLHVHHKYYILKLKQQQYHFIIFNEGDIKMFILKEKNQKHSNDFVVIHEVHTKKYFVYPKRKPSTHCNDFNICISLQDAPRLEWAVKNAFARYNQRKRRR